LKFLAFITGGMFKNRIDLLITFYIILDFHWSLRKQVRATEKSVFNP
jgi:hypothetical protein